MGRNGDLRVTVPPLLEAKAGNRQEAVLYPPEAVSGAKAVAVGEGEQKGERQTDLCSPGHFVFPGVGSQQDKPTYRVRWG